MTPRQQAILNGDNTYFTGIPCIHGHVSRRNTISRSCIECNRVKNLDPSRRAEINAANRKQYVKSQNEATSSNDIWRVPDIDKVVERRPDGKYVKSASVWAAELGRTISSIKYVRGRYGGVQKLPSN